MARTKNTAKKNAVGPSGLPLATVGGTVEKFYMRKRLYPKLAPPVNKNEALRSSCLKRYGRQPKVFKNVDFTLVTLMLKKRVTPSLKHLWPFLFKASYS